MRQMLCVPANRNEASVTAARLQLQQQSFWYTVLIRVARKLNVHNKEHHLPILVIGFRLVFNARARYIYLLPNTRLA